MHRHCDARPTVTFLADVGTKLVLLSDRHVVYENNLPRVALHSASAVADNGAIYWLEVHLVLTKEALGRYEGFGSNFQARNEQSIFVLLYRPPSHTNLSYLSILLTPPLRMMPSDFVKKNIDRHGEDLEWWAVHDGGKKSDASIATQASDTHTESYCAVSIMWRT